MWVCVWGHCKQRAGMSCSTSSQMWGSWYLPSFLVKEGSLTLMYMASLMVLVMPCDSLFIMEKFSSLVKCSVVLNGQRWGIGPKMLLVSVPKNSTSLPYVFHGTPWMVTSVSIDDSSFVTNFVLVFGSYQ